MRPDQGLVLLAAAAVVAAVLAHPVPGPTWTHGLALVAAAIYLVATARRRLPPRYTPVRPLVVIPVKDNVATVGDVVARALRHGMPVVVVDDGSTDGSGDAARAAGARVLVHPVNRGKGHALLTAMRWGWDHGHSHILCLDADGQHDPDDLPAFYAAVRKEPEAIFCGVRDLSTAPGRSQFGRRFSNFWIWAETGWRVGDSQCGFRAYPIGPVLDLDLGGSRYDMEVEVLVRALWAGTPVRDLPCNVYYPPADERVSSFRPFVDNARISWMNAQLVVGRVVWPPRWITRVHHGRTWTGRSRGSLAGWKVLLLVLGVTGRWPAYVAVAGVATWFRVFDTTPGVRAYLARVGGGSAWRLYVHFATALLDRFLFLQRGPEAFRYTFEGVEHLRGAFEAGRGAIVLTAHFGNLEVAGTDGASERRKRLAVLRFDSGADHGTALLDAFPDTYKPRVISVNGADGFASLHVLRELRDGAVVAMHGDRVLDERTVPVELLGGTVRFPAGPWMLAALAGVPVIVAGCFKTDARTYHIVALPPRDVRFDRRSGRDAQIQAWAQDYARTLDGWIRRWPLQWYNFHDVWADPDADAAPP